MAVYQPASYYFQRLRVLLQDLVVPYRYDDATLQYCLNTAIRETVRLRADIFLDLKYQQPLDKGDLGKGSEDVHFDPTKLNMIIPIPEAYTQPILWYAAATAQFLDTSDTQDQRAAGMMQKFVAAMMTVAA